MAFKLTDLLKNISLFPTPSVSRLEKFTKPEYGGLLSEEDVKSAQAQANLSGLLTTALGAYAAPKTKRAGSILPYLAEAYVTKGMPTAGNVGDVALSSVIQGQKLRQLGKTNELTKQLLQDPRVKGDKARELLAYTDASGLAKQLDETINVRQGTDVIKKKAGGGYEVVYSSPKTSTVKPFKLPTSGQVGYVNDILSRELPDSDTKSIAPYVTDQIAVLKRENPNLSNEDAIKTVIGNMKQTGAIEERSFKFGRDNFVFDMSKASPIQNTPTQSDVGTIVQDAQGNMAIITGYDNNGDPIYEEYFGG